LNLTFKRLTLLSVLSIVLGVSLVYVVGYEFGPKNPTQSLPTSSDSQSNGNTDASAGTAIDFAAHLLVFAYSSEAASFVQASVTVTGPESPVNVAQVLTNGTVINKTFLNETLNGTTTTDLQNPLSFTVLPGVYCIGGTYGSAQPQSATVNVTAIGSYGEAVLNFGSSSPPPLGHIIVAATYLHGGGSPGPLPFLEYLQASITITGPETLNGTTSTDEWNPTVFTVLPGAYSVFATYESATQNATVNVTVGNFARVPFDFNP